MTMFFDSHIHTSFSADSEMRAEEALARAKEQGIGLVFTEHLDYDYPSAGKEQFIFDPEAYWTAYEPLRAAGNLSLGVEMGMMASARKKNAAFVQRVPFDFVLGSIHFLECKDLYYPETFAGREKAEMYHEYFTVMCDEIYAHPFIDALAHIDYIARNATFAHPEISYGDFADDIDAVLRALIETDTVLELNTRRFDAPCARASLVPIFRRYRELGGRDVTLGSDAHRTDAIGFSFAAARAMAESLRLRTVTFFARRKEYC